MVSGASSQALGAVVDGAVLLRTGPIFGESLRIGKVETHSIETGLGLIARAATAAFPRRQ